MFVYFMIGHRRPEPTPQMEFSLTLEVKDGLTPEDQAKFGQLRREFVAKLEAGNFLK